jgi:FkbH-like protein
MSGMNQPKLAADAAHREARSSSVQPIKCVVWDLDNTLWTGTLAEGDQVLVRDEAVSMIRDLDQRGILQSIVSRNSAVHALPVLEKAGLLEYFLYPQIDWSRKSEGVARIAQSLNIGIDAMALVDDDPFERDEVQFVHPVVECFDAKALDRLAAHPRLNHGPITEDARSRRLLYQAEMQRRIEEERHADRMQDFLAGLGMKLDILPATEGDLDRAAELTSRTHQLNTTGIIYSSEELRALLWHPDYLLYTARLEDKYGGYGTIGLALAKIDSHRLVIKLLLMSCRVISRGVGMVLLTYLMNLAKARGLGMEAEFIPNERNRIMDVTFRFAGFEDDHRSGDLVVLKHDLKSIAQYPEYIEVRSIGCGRRAQS